MSGSPSRMSAAWMEIETVHSTNLPSMSRGSVRTRGTRECHGKGEWRSLRDATTRHLRHNGPRFETKLSIAVTVGPAIAPSLANVCALEPVLAEALVDLVVSLAHPPLDALARLDGFLGRVHLHVIAEMPCAVAARVQRRE